MTECIEARRAPFDLAGTLPMGLSVLEASAGTGKTYALTALATRFIADQGIEASELCIVSFTEAATAELRGRIRARLVDAAEHLERLEAGAHDLDESSDDLLRALVVDDPQERSRRRVRLRNAIAEFDLVTIATIHGFCHRVLASAGDRTDLMITDGTREVTEVINDLLVGADDSVHRHGFDTDRLVSTVIARLAMPHAVPFLGDPPKRAPTERQRADADAVATAVALVDRAVAELDRRRSHSPQRTFDALLTETRSLLTGSQAAPLQRALRDRYRVVLIDEFQDTDHVQWEIFRRAFVDPSDDPLAPARTVVLVGDPKQSIYRFRSAELGAYLAAVDRAGSSVATLETNWRSDSALLDGLDRLFGDFEFGDPRVRFHPVSSPPHLRGSRLRGDERAPVQLRWVPPDETGSLDTPRAWRQVRADVLATVDELMNSDLAFSDLADGSIAEGVETGAARRVRRGDLAILTRTNAEATQLALDLTAAGHPAATAASNSVLDSDAAREWERLLLALARPGSPGPVRAAAVGWFIGLSPEELDALDEEGIASLHERMRELASMLQDGGIPALLAAARAGGLHQRLRARLGGERDLTDVDHIVELLHSLTSGRRPTPSSLLSVLREAAAEADRALVARDALSRRIDRDDDAIQVMTIHKAKGLEFPIVLCPTLWRPSSKGHQIPHAQLDGIRQLDLTWTAGLGKSRPAATRFRDLDVSETEAEGRRVLYVALTRARHRCVVWWAPLTTSTATVALADLLGHATGVETPALNDLREFADASAGTLEVVELSADRAPQNGPSARSRRVVPDSGEHSFDAAARGRSDEDLLDVAVARRRLDQAWRIWSFTAITAIHHARQRGELTSVPSTMLFDRADHEAGGADEQDPDRPLDGSSAGPIGAPPSSAGALRLATAPMGASFGTAVHEVLERVSFEADDLQADLERHSAEVLRRHPQPIDAETLAAGLCAPLEAPLGGPLGSTRLRDVTRRDRLDELAFQLPLGRLSTDVIAQVLGEHLPADDPARTWAEHLASAPPIELCGTLVGSIDLVARTGGPAEPRYWVMDYKSNQLGVEATYERAELDAAMIQHQYPLQALLYLVALRRYLRWRDPSEATSSRIGGAAYLFLRGMDPRRSSSTAAGVWWWEPPLAAIDAVDRLFAVGAT